MASLSLDPRLNIHAVKNHQQHGALVEEIEGLIRVYKDGHVERPPIIPNVSCSTQPQLRVTARDVVIDSSTNLWMRVYVPQGSSKLPLLVYFHGGGFCVGSPAWSCYHDFLANLASKAGCVLMSVNYRLAPENHLPVAYEDGFKTVMWVKEKAANGSSEHCWWLNTSNLSHFFLAGDSAGANIAYNVAIRLGSSRASNPAILKPLCHRGTILIQPFFGGEARTASERAPQSPRSALTLSASDTYWRLSLPAGSNREHSWCNPLADGIAKSIILPAMMVCLSDMDILRDRNMEFCSAMVNAGKAVQMVVYKGVGHAFQILHNSPLSKARAYEMTGHLKNFINS